MTKLNNKGFAVSTILYGALSLTILVLMLIFGIMKASKDMNKDLVDSVEDNLSNCVLEEVDLEKCRYDNPDVTNACIKPQGIYNLCIKKDKSLAKQILKDNVAYADDVSSTYVSNSTGIDFSQGASDTNGKGLYYTNVNTENFKKVYYFRGDVNNNYVKFGKLHSYQNICLFDGVEVTTYGTTNGSNKITEVSSCSNVCLIPDGRYVSGGAWPHEICTEQWGGTVVGIAQWGVQEQDLLWRIVRINEDGSVRLITDATVGQSAYNPSANDNSYVGYMYGTPGSDSYSETHKNTNNSTIKTYLDNWYTNNLSSYSSYLADAGFCNDRSVASSAGLWSEDDTALGYSRNITFYGARSRTKQPQFKCPQKNDLFTLVTSSKGNKKLIYPVGLLTYDEVIYAGSRNSYLVNDTIWWTMTPYVYHTAPGGAVVPFVDGIGGLLHMSSLSFAYGVRPVINLSNYIDVSGGDGTKDNPYVIDY